MHLETLVEERSAEAALSHLLIKAAREISVHMDPARNRSRSFQVFREGLLKLISG